MAAMQEDTLGPVQIMIIEDSEEMDRTGQDPDEGQVRLSLEASAKVEQEDDDTGRSEGSGGWNSTLASLRERPKLASHLSHLSVISTETTEGDSSEGNTFSVDSDEMAFKSSRGRPTSGSPASDARIPNGVGEPHIPTQLRNQFGDADHRPPMYTRSYSLSTISTPLPNVSSPLVVAKSSSNDVQDNTEPAERITISRTSSGSTEGPDSTSRASGSIATSRVSPVSEDSGTVFGGSRSGEPTRKDIRHSSISGHRTNPAVATDQTDEVHELRAEDRLDDWSENQDKAHHTGVHEHRKEIRDQFKFRPAGGQAYDTEDSSYATYFGSKSSDVPTSKGKEREWLPADHFDAIEEEYKRATRNFADNERSRLDCPHSPNPTTSEQDRARFEAAIRARHHTVRFEPQRPDVDKGAEPSEGVQAQRARRMSSSGPDLQHAARHSPHLHSQTTGLNRRNSAKRAHSNKMSWDLALLSPAPHNDVEENERDRDAKTRGSGRSPLSTPSTNSDFNVIEQAFRAAIDSNNPGTSGVVHLELSAAARSTGGTNPPQSPSGETVTSRSSDVSRHKFRSYNGPSLPEIETPRSQADLFYLAFGNGGSSSRQSLTGKTVQKKRERTAEDKVERDQIAVDNAEKLERRNQRHQDDGHYDDKIQFERAVNDDSDTTTERQTESAGTSPLEFQSHMTDFNQDENGADERRRKRREAKKRENGDSSPEPIISAGVIMPITGMTIFTKDGRAVSKDAMDLTMPAIRRAETEPTLPQTPNPPRPSPSLGFRSFTKTPKVSNSGDVLRPQGSFTTARRPNMTVDPDAIRVQALASDDRFDTIDFDQLQAAADAGDQIAEEHLRQRSKWDRLSNEQWMVVIPADLEQNGPPVRRRNTISSATSRRRSPAEPVVLDSSRKPSPPVMQSIPEDATAHLRSTQAERKTSKEIQSQVEQMESRQSSESTNSSGRLSTISLGSAVEALMDSTGDRDNPFDLPIKLSSLSDRSGSSDRTRVGTGSNGHSKSQPSTPNDTLGRRQLGYIANPMFSSNQDFFNLPAFPPVPLPLSPTDLTSRTPSRKGTDKACSTAVARSSPARGPELFMDVARLTSMQVEKDRALNRARDARNKGLATGSSATRAAKVSNDRRLRVDEANDGKGKVDPAIVSAMSSFGISYESNRRPSVDNTVDPLQGGESHEQRRAERQRKKRMLRQLEHERVIRQTPMEEYSNPMDTYLGKARLSESRDAMPQLIESNDEEDEDERAKEVSATDTGHIPPPSGMPSGEG